MDRRLLVTAAYGIHLMAGVLFVLGWSAANVSFTEMEAEFLLVIGYGGPALAIGMIWFRNYEYGPPLLIAASAITVWFTINFLFIQETPANVFEVTGPGSSSYTAAGVSLIATTALCAWAGAWIWYHENEWFRSRVDRAIRPPSSRQ